MPFARRKRRLRNISIYSVKMGQKIKRKVCTGQRMCKTWGRLQPGVPLAVVRLRDIFCACHGTLEWQHGSLFMGSIFTENGSLD